MPASIVAPNRPTRPETANPQPVSAAPSARVLSVDALRGFDMFWIIGAGALVHALEPMRGNELTRFLSTQLQHVTWEGFRFYDLIFPLFLFLIGVSVVFSLDRALAAGGRGAALRRIVRRSVLLFLLGVFHSGGLTEKWPAIALGGVLHRIAACYFLTAITYCFFSVRPRLMAGIAIVFLTGYWALLTFMPFPDFKIDRPTVAALAKQTGSDAPSAIARAVPARVHGVYEEGRNLTNYFDFRFLPGKKAQIYYINEGLLSTFPAVAICLGGVFAGRLLINDRAGQRRKVVWLLGAGLALVGLGFLWSLQFPMIKRIWSSSFCLAATGYAAVLLAVFYLVIDVWRCEFWCRPFVWIGMNPITIYLAVNIISFPKVAERLVGGDVKLFFDTHVAAGFGQLVIAFTSLGLAILLCCFLHRKKIFLRV